MSKKILDSGAEATIFLDGTAVIKDRVKKDYRLKEIDEKLRKARTRREAKVLDKLKTINFPAPTLHDMCDKAMQLRMDMIQGNKIRDVLYRDPVALSQEIGKKIGILHANDIIHGDLTTSNMILEKEKTLTWSYVRDFKKRPEIIQIIILLNPLYYLFDLLTFENVN